MKKDDVLISRVSGRAWKVTKTRAKDGKVELESPCDKGMMKVRIDRSMLHRLYLVK